jgi:hypothetical protein
MELEVRQEIIRRGDDGINMALNVSRYLENTGYINLKMYGVAKFNLRGQACACSIMF